MGIQQNTYEARQLFVPPAEVKIQTSRGASGSLKDALKFFEIMKDKLIADYANPDPNASMTIYGKTLTGQDRYGALGTFLLGQWIGENTNIVESLSNMVSNETKLFQTGDQLLTGR